MPINISHKRIDLELVELNQEICDKYQLPNPKLTPTNIPSFISGTKYYLDFEKTLNERKVDFLYYKIDWYAMVFLNGVLLSNEQYYWDRDYNSRSLKLYFNLKLKDVITICWNEVEFDLKVV